MSNERNQDSDDVSVPSNTVVRKKRPIYESNRSENSMLDILNSSASYQERGWNGNRYPESTMNLGVYEMCKNGRGSYLTKAKNMPLPCLSTIKRYIEDLSPRFQPGTIYARELKKFLLTRNYPLDVIVSVDGTRVSSKVEYDAPTRCLIGLTAPLDHLTGMPDMTTLTDLTPSGMLDALQQRTRSENIEVFMVKPLQPGSSSMPICVINTDNRFAAGHVVQQMDTIVDALAVEEITVHCLAADGDSRYLKAQKHITSFGLKKVDWHGFTLYADPESKLGAMQDGCHLVNKLKMRLSNPAASLFPGTKIATLSDITSFYYDKKLKLSIDDHGLVDDDIKNSDHTRDKMNLAGTLRICSPKVIECLKKVPGSEGTQEYVRLMLMLKEALIDTETEGSTIIYNMIYVCSFFRRWRQFLIDSGYGASHFVTANVWTCVELNVVFIARLANMGCLKLASILNSQTCEEFFRTLRSFTPSLVTNINFTTKESFQKIQHVNALMTVTNELNAKEGVNFAEKMADSIIPDADKFIPKPELNIDLLVQMAMCAAKKSAEALGINSVEADPSTIIFAPPNRADLVAEAIAKDRPSLEPKFAVKSSVVGDFRIVSAENFDFVDAPPVSNCFQKVKSFNPFATEPIRIQTFLNKFDTKELVSTDRVRRFIGTNQSQCSQLRQDVYRLTEPFAKLLDCALNDWIVIYVKSKEELPYMVGKVSKIQNVTASKSRKKTAYTFDSFAFNDALSRRSFILSPIYAMDFNSGSLIDRTVTSFFDESLYVATVNSEMLNFKMKTFHDELFSLFEEDV